MPVPAVTLRLSGPAPAERLHAWVRALARVSADRRLIDLAAVSGADAPPTGLDALLADTGVELATDAVAPHLVVLADASALVSPTSLRRLVAAADGGDLLSTRVLPHGTTVDAAGTEVPAPHPCVAVPVGAPAACRHAASPGAAVDAATAAGSVVRRLDAAAVLVGPTDGQRRVPHQPYGHPASLPSTAAHQLLRAVGVTPPPLPLDQPQRPFLSVITRTQGTRVQCLEEVLTCLAAQTVRDLEVLVVCHRVDADGRAAVRRVLDDLPAWLRERTRLLDVERPGRSAPLNDALDVASGRYAVVLDDDDAVDVDWAAGLAALEAERPGVVLRSVALAQHVRPVEVIDDGTARGPAPAEAGPAHRVWPEQFSMVDHLCDNASPPMTFAVPRGVFADLGHRFDESLDTTEDWDFLVRAAGITGVASTTAVTATYRVWTDTEGSRHLHGADEWAHAREAVLAGIDGRVTLLEPGAARGVRELRAALEAQTGETFRFAELNEQAAADLVAVNEAVVALRAALAESEDKRRRAVAKLRELRNDRP